MVEKEGFEDVEKAEERQPRVGSGDGLCWAQRPGWRLAEGFVWGSVER